VTPFFSGIWFHSLVSKFPYAKERHANSYISLFQSTATSTVCATDVHWSFWNTRCAGWPPDRWEFFSFTSSRFSKRVRPLCACIAVWRHDRSRSVRFWTQSVQRWWISELLQND